VVSWTCWILDSIALYLYFFYAENVDYDPVSQELQFGPMMPSEIEFEITILSDNITEEEEQFIAMLESSDRSVILSTSSANITIVDTTGTLPGCKWNMVTLLQLKDSLQFFYCFLHV